MGDLNAAALFFHDENTELTIKKFSKGWEWKKDDIRMGELIKTCPDYIKKAVGVTTGVDWQCIDLGLRRRNMTVNFTKALDYSWKIVTMFDENGDFNQNLKARCCHGVTGGIVWEEASPYGSVEFGICPLSQTMTVSYECFTWTDSSDRLLKM